ncbi:MAG TPA: FUSC family protein [Bacillales bacterium]|nr:FUSC family protein [Bacillales bacterium]
MKPITIHLQTIRYWMARLSASDPGLTRFQTAAKAVGSVMLEVFAMTLINNYIAHAGITVAILGGVLGMISTVAVVDNTVEEKRMTTLLMAVSSACALTLSAVLSQFGHYFVDALLLLIVFLVLYVQQFKTRYFSLCMVAFISIYISALLHIKLNQLSWYYVAIAVGVASAFAVNYIFFRPKPDKTLKRTISSFHIQINLTLDLIIDMIRDLNTNPQRIKHLQRNVVKLNEYARMVSGQFEEGDPRRIWPGIQTKQLRLYIFDAMMLMETLFPAVKRLKEMHALEDVNVRYPLLKLMLSLRDANVLYGEYDSASLQHAEMASDQLKEQLLRLKTENKQYRDWLYLLRRIESISHHIIDEIKSIQKMRLGHKEAPGEESEETQNEEEGTQENDSEDEKGLPDSTKKAIQAVTAGTFSVALGYLLTPAHQYWMLISTLVVFFGTESVGRTIVKAGQRFAGTLFGAIVGFGLDHFIAGIPFVEVPLLFLCIFMGFYLIPISYALMIFWITILLAIMYNLLLGGISEQLLASRVFDTLIGAGLGAGATAFLLPKKTTVKVTESMGHFLTLLKENVSAHLDRFTGTETETTRVHQAFELDQNLQVVKDDAEPLTRRPGNLSRSSIEHQITVLTAMNYYAKHLVASTNRSLPEIDDKTRKALKNVEACVNENIDTLCRLLQGEDGKHLTVWDLRNYRELIERSPDQKNAARPFQMIYDLYYIWRINKSVLSLAEDLGAQVTEKETEEVLETPS